MATALKVLGQTASASSLSLLYQVPVGASTVASSIAICNQGANYSTFRVAVQPLSGAIVTKHYLYYDVILGGNDTFIATIGLTLSATDAVTVQSASANVSFHLYGQENT